MQRPIRVTRVRAVRFIFVILAFCWAGWASAQSSGAIARIDMSRSGMVETRGGATLTLGLSQGVPYRVFTLTAPNRLVLDFGTVDWAGSDLTVFTQNRAISDVRAGPFQPGWSRLVLTLTRPMVVDTAGMTIEPGDGRASISVLLEESSQAAFGAAAGALGEPTWNRITPAQLAPAKRADSADNIVVMIDPGHGGIDPGAERQGLTEAALMLAFARELKEVLRRAGGFDVYMTRDADVFVSLERRVAMAHQVEADVFVSLHADALEEGRARGAAVYTLSDKASDEASAKLAERHNRADLLAGLDLTESDDQIAQVLMDIARLDTAPRSDALAHSLLRGIENAVGFVHKRPFRQAGFAVLKAADIPSVLVEVGFLSTEEDLRNLQDPIWRSAMAAGLRDGLQSWALEDASLAQLRRR